MNTGLKTAVIFGGNGFIGTHFAAHLLKHGIAQEVFLADIEPIGIARWPKELQELNASGKIKYVKLDVRKPIENRELPSHADLIVNLAAVHREPGHQTHEYFETNLPGAENVCAWAEKVNCNWIIFTSSIAPYGTTTEDDSERNEKTLPTPNTPYGISKLVAEKIHIAWQRAGHDRKLMIVRPGVIFGEGEKGNVSRMIRAVLGRYFFYTGNKATRKAGGYIKELCYSMEFMIQRQAERNIPLILFNFTMDPAPTMQEYVQTVKKVSGKKRIVPSMPYPLLMFAAQVIQIVTLGKSGINPMRIYKLIKPNNIVPEELRKAGYKYHYTLEEALADWKKEDAGTWN